MAVEPLLSVLPVRARHALGAIVLIFAALIFVLAFGNHGMNAGVLPAAQDGHLDLVFVNGFVQLADDLSDLFVGCLLYTSPSPRD